MSNSTSTYPDHVRQLQDLSQLPQFVRSAAFVTGQVNLGLHKAEFSPDVEQSIAHLTEIGLKAADRYPGMSGRFIDTAFLEHAQLSQNKTDALTEKLISDLKRHEISFSDDKLMPLAIEVVARAQHFAAGWTLPAARETDTPNFSNERSASLYRDVFSKMFQPKYFVEVMLEVRPYGDRLFSALGQPTFLNSYESVGTPPEFCYEVNLSGRGMRWTPNANVIRTPRDINMPQRAEIRDWEDFRSLEVGETAVFSGNRETGLAVADACPWEPDERPVVNLSLRRHVQRPS
jgi:hypothetical protein